MKTLIAAALLLALASPAHAATDASEDCKWTDDETACIKQGMQDYRAGQCFHARPYADDKWRQSLWKKGYYLQQKKAKRDMTHCFR